MEEVVSLAFLALTFGFIFPGAAALRMWDFVGRHDTRSRTSLLGMGAFIGILSFAALQGLEVIELRQLLSTDQPSLAAMLQPANLGFFVVLTICLVSTAAALARMTFSVRGQAFAARLFNRTLEGSNWAEVTKQALDRWVVIKTSAEHEWLGKLVELPDTSGGHLKLAEPEYFDGENWLGGNDAVVLPVESIQYIYILKKEENGHGEDRRTKGFIKARWPFKGCFRWLKRRRLAATADSHDVPAGNVINTE